MTKIQLGTVLEPEPGTGTETGARTRTRTVLRPWTELETKPELEMVRKVLKPLPELVPGQGTEPETMPEIEVEMGTDQGNKYSVLHP